MKRVLAAALACSVALGARAEPVSSVLRNKTSTMTMSATTTAYAAGQLIAPAGGWTASLSAPSFTIGAAGAFVPRIRLSINDATSTAWGGVGVQIDFWSTPPIFSTSDRTSFSLASGSASHLAAYLCTFSAETGDGVYAECAPSVGTAPISLSGSIGASSVFWTAQTTTASGVTGAFKTMTLTVEMAE